MLGTKPDRLLANPEQIRNYARDEQITVVVFLNQQVASYIVDREESGGLTYQDERNLVLDELAGSATSVPSAPPAVFQSTSAKSATRVGDRICGFEREAEREGGTGDHDDEHQGRTETSGWSALGRDGRERHEESDVHRDVQGLQVAQLPRSRAAVEEGVGQTVSGAGSAGWPSA